MSLIKLFSGDQYTLFLDVEPSFVEIAITLIPILLLLLLYCHTGIKPFDFNCFDSSVPTKPEAPVIATDLIVLEDLIEPKKLFDRLFTNFEMNITPINKEMILLIIDDSISLIFRLR